jgi:hypothetical protein
MEPHFEPNDGYIDYAKGMPALSRYVDVGGFWADEYFVQIDHAIYQGLDEPEVHIKVNGQDLGVFCNFIETGSNCDVSTGINPKDEVFREPVETIK